MKLAEWLDKNDVKRVDFAAKLRVQPSVITAWCSGKYKPGNENALKVADATNGEVTLNDFVLSAESRR